MNARKLGATAALIVAVSLVGCAAAMAADRSLDGGANNRHHPTWGEAGTQYLRVAPARYSDGIAAMVSGPPPRWISNRIFNDVGQNLFSENAVSQWGWTWGQFVDHDMGLADETPGENAPIAFASSDPLEQYRDDAGSMAFTRTPAAPGTGVTTARQQINTVSSVIDGSQVYGTTPGRLEWLRAGPLDGNLDDNEASLLLPGGFLPRADARGDPANAPPVDLFGPITAAPERAVEAGDVRANENIALTAVQTLFAREHNRIVALLPSRLSQEARFRIARRVVGAEIQFITYTEFLPAMGVRLGAYSGYRPQVDPAISNEFATVGFRGHSQVHGEFEYSVPTGTYSAAQQATLAAMGVSIRDDGTTEALAIPLAVAYGNPDLLQAVGLDQVLESLDEHEYRNDEQIDNALRSVLFQMPRAGATDCYEPQIDPNCFLGVEDLGAVDIQRGRDHGMPGYNAMRKAYGLPSEPSFAAVTGEATDAFPDDPLIDPADPIDDPSILDFVQLRDAAGDVLPAGDQDDAITGIRRTTLAARLRAVYGSVGKMDAFVGMLAEQHLSGSELGPLQSAMWRRQFTVLRDGDRFFYLRDRVLGEIQRRYGITYRHSLAELIRLDTGASVPDDVFHAH